MKIYMDGYLKFNFKYNYEKQVLSTFYLGKY